MSVELHSASPDGHELPEAETAPPLALGGRTVLYIEDNLANLQLVERVLERFADVRLLPAMQGNLGLELAREQRPDLVLLDLHLPDLPGREVLLRLKAEPALRDVPIVVLTADATEGEQKRMLAAGAHAYLTKPFDVRRFLSVVQECLDSDAAPQ
jgi:CheY-like chemotaxis protein